MLFIAIVACAFAAFGVCADALAPPLDSLVSRNAAPTIMVGKPPIFPAKYDREEDVRVLRQAIPAIAVDADLHLAALIANSNDKRHSVTVEYYGFVQNWSVGDVCHFIAQESLTAGCKPGVSSLRLSRRLWAAIDAPDFLRPREQVAKWHKANARPDVPFYELQARVCDELGRRVRDDYTDLAEIDEREKVSAVLAECARKLRATQMHVEWRGFRGENVVEVSAADVRKNLEK